MTFTMVYKASFFQTLSSVMDKKIFLKKHKKQQTKNKETTTPKQNKQKSVKTHSNFVIPFFTCFAFKKKINTKQFR